jgi:7-carboxy-7-deazaguanine synthase (Cx14CxxC type)
LSAYAVKEMFLTLQGEGANAGRPSVFCRFSGCNLWSGLEADRGKGPGGCSAWCDTDFRGTDGTHGGRYSAPALAAKAAELWGPTRPHRFAVLTGGEPMLQVDRVLIDVLHRFDFRVAIETNGTRPVPDSADWVTVSPKAGAPPVHRTGQELKLVWPQEGIDPADYLGWAFGLFYLQPKDGPDAAENTRACVDYCLANPAWRLSVQSHKALGIR